MCSKLPKSLLHHSSSSSLHVLAPRSIEVIQVWRQTNQWCTIIARVPSDLKCACCFKPRCIVVSSSWFLNFIHAMVTGTKMHVHWTFRQTCVLIMTKLPEVRLVVFKWFSNIIDIHKVRAMVCTMNVSMQHTTLCDCLSSSPSSFPLITWHP